MKLIKLEEGKKYRNRKGEVVEITNASTVDGCEKKGSDGYYYFSNGRFVQYRASCLYDLIEEVIEPAIAEDQAKKPHKHCELIKAWANGAEIEVWNTNVEKWLLCGPNTTWDEFREFRIKPEPKPDVVWFNNVFSHATSGGFLTIESANKNSLNRLAVLKITITFNGDKPNLPTVEVISHEDAIKMGEKE